MLRSDIVRILESGGSVDISGEQFNRERTEQLIELAKKHGGHITISGKDQPRFAIARFLELGKGHVTIRA